QRKADVLARDRAEQGRGVRGEITSWLNGHSLLYVLVRRHTENLMASRRADVPPGTTPRAAGERHEAPPYYLSVFRDDEQDVATHDWHRAYRILDELKRQTTARGAKLMVVLVPAPFQISEAEFRRWVEWAGATAQPMSRRKPQDMVLAWCRASGT